MERFSESHGFHPMAYAFEPIVKELRSIATTGHMEAGLGLCESVSGGVSRVGNIDWCVCNHCQPMCTSWESRCCLETDLDHLIEGEACITMSQMFSIFCLENDVLEVAMLSLREVRGEPLKLPINSR